MSKKILGINTKFIKLLIKYLQLSLKRNNLYNRVYIFYKVFVLDIFNTNKLTKKTNISKTNNRSLVYNKLTLSNLWSAIFRYIGINKLTFRVSLFILYIYSKLLTYFSPQYSEKTHFGKKWRKLTFIAVLPQRVVTEVKMC